MKLLISIVFFMLDLVYFSYGQQKLIITPEYPQPGQMIHIVYNPDTPGATIADTVNYIDLVFTYSNFYEQPNKLPLSKKNRIWETNLLVPKYGVYATFILQSGNQADQLSPTKHFPIPVYNGTKRVVRGYLYESYSLQAQEGKSKDIAARKAVLVQKELENYPLQYEGRLQRLNHEMSIAKKEDVPALRAKAEQIVAEKFYENPGNMGYMNTTTMGYLMIGENSRLDSLRKVVKEKYPYTEAGYELRLDDITSNTDKDKVAAQLLQILKEENNKNKDFLKTAHEALFKFYANKKMPKEALGELKKIGLDESPYRPQTLKRQAEILYQNGIALDKAMELALKSLALADTFPAGLIRYFPETGYLPAYVSAADRRKSELEAKAQLNVLVGLIEQKRGNSEAAQYYVSKGLEYSFNQEALTRAAEFYAKNKNYEKAYNLYKETATKYPLDTLSFRLMQDNFRLFNKDEKGLAYVIERIKLHWSQEMKKELMGEIIDKDTPDFLSNLVDLNGKSLAKDFLKNKIVVLDFWATWCVPCMKEMPYMEIAYDQYKNNPDVVFMVINSGSKNELSDAQNWWGNKKYNFPVYYNKDRNIGDMLGFNVIPATYVIDKNNRIRFKTLGFEGPIIAHKIPAAIELLKEGI